MIEKQEKEKDGNSLAEGLSAFAILWMMPVVLISLIKWCVLLWRWFFPLILVVAIGCGDDDWYPLCEAKTLDCPERMTCIFDGTPEHAHCYGLCDPNVAEDGVIKRTDEGWIIQGQCQLWERCRLTEPRWYEIYVCIPLELLDEKE